MWNEEQGLTIDAKYSAVLMSEALPRPTIVCLCGSVRFLDAFDAASLQETLAGRIVLSVGSHRQRDEDAMAHLSGIEHTDALNRLDALHRQKIDLADEILVINVGGYIGDSTRGEIAYAYQQGKQVRWLEDPN
ncbi:hypothetical protein [Deinococcus humi]|uniref:Uncharacterized protein n=1 Tax=Deinococcus humi TaxID=662880 RepID=A0A7W8JZ71_9DEIO|nr:hypothetical protein [Deinococcus humi]MBB5365931.1 hypothetical protein [Deinococcus humi]GGO40401.1 hypothetical protein GCM10008949_49830 [Deinococcus humi]